MHFQPMHFTPVLKKILVFFLLLYLAYILPYEYTSSEMFQMLDMLKLYFQLYVKLLNNTKQHTEFSYSVQLLLHW